MYSNGMTEVSAERAAELTLEALTDAAEHCRRKARGRSLYGPQWVNVRAMYRERAAEFDSLRAMLNAGQSPRPAWVVERAAKLTGESKAVQDVVISRRQAENWAGVTLTDDDYARLVKCVEFSSVPEAIDIIVHDALGISRPGDDDDEV